MFLKVKPPDMTDWHINSNDKYEANILDTLEKYDLHQLITCHEGRSLDVFLATGPTLVLGSAIDSALDEQNSSNGKKCSDHHAYKTYLSLPTSSKITTPAIKRAYQKTDWDDFNKQIVSQPFTPYCYSNIDVLLLQWYKWLENIIDEKIPRVTKHRAEIPPWIRSSTSHQMKIVATMKRKYAKANSLSLHLKIKKAEKSLNEEIKMDQAIFEAKVFKNRRMSDLQKYLKSIHKKHPLPTRRNVP